MKDGKIWKILGYSLLVLLFLEILVGITNALFYVPVPISILHSILAASITGVLAWAFSLAGIASMQLTNSSAGVYQRLGYQPRATSAIQKISPYLQQ